MHTEHLNGIDIALETRGNPDHPTLVFVHGLMGNRTGMALLAEAMSTHFFTVCYDCRGHGHSSKPAAFTLADHARDLTAIIGRFGGRADVFGYSMGAYIAAQAAILSPQTVRRLVLAVPKPCDDGHGPSIARLLQAHGLTPETATEEITEKLIADALWAPETTAARRAEINAASNLRAREARLPLLNAAQRQAISRALAGFDLRPGLPHLPMPVLVLAGKYDGINPPAAARAVADLIPGSRFELFEHSGHMLRQEEPQKLEQTLRAFLQAV